MATENRQPCLICGQLAYLEEHHVIPICYGGPKDGKTIFICGDCHEAIHRTAESLSAKTVKPKNWFKSTQALKTARPYVQAIINAKLRKKEQVDPQYQDVPRRRLIVVELTDKEWMRIRKAGKDRGYSSNTQFIHDYLVRLTKF